MQRRIIGNRYVLHELIGKGGMGSVYRAQDRLSGDVVALKHVLYLEDAAKDDSMFSATKENRRLTLAHEFQTLASLRHPNVISVLDYGFDASFDIRDQTIQQPYFTMDFLEGHRTLGDAARSAPIHTVIDLIIQMLQALAYLHRRGVMHRDLKPANVVVTRDNRIKLLDFGLASVSGKTDKEEQTSGTLLYIAPEVLQGASGREAADLYAVGVMSYELLAGRYPFRRDKASSLLEDVLLTPPDLTPIYRLRAPGNPNIGDALAAIIGQLMEKAPRDRPPTANEVVAALCEAVGRELPKETRAIRESYLEAAQLVGRDRELGTLTSALDRAERGAGSSWLVGGESGVGKSRLLNELRTRAMVRGALVVYGQSESASGGARYQMWRSALRRVALTTSLDDLEAGVLKVLIPDISTIIERDVPDPPPLDGPGAQQRLLDVISSVFRRQEGTVLVILEDLQWESESLEIVRTLNDLAPENSMLIVGSYRDEERPDLPDELPKMQVMRLERLSDRGIEELSASMLGTAGRKPEIVSLLRQETEGNVFFLVEVVRALAERAGGLDNISEMSLPSEVFAGGVQLIVQRRLERVPEAARELLSLAAVIGRQLDLALLEQMRPDADLYDWLLQCADASVLELQDEKWQFVHEKIREALIKQISDERLSALHLEVAQTTEQVYADAPSRAKMLSYHWRLAGDRAKERAYTILTAEQMLEVGAYTQAGAMFQYALELANEIGPEEARSPNQVLILRRMGDVLARLGESELTRTFYRQSLELARDIEDQPGIAHGLASKAYALLIGGEYDDAYTNYEESLVIAETLGDRALQVTAKGGLAQVMRTRGEYQQAREMWEEVLALAEELDRPLEISRAFNGIADTATMLKELGEAEEIYGRSLRLCQEIGHRTGIARATNGLANVAYYQRDYDQALVWIRQVIVIDRSLDDLIEVGYDLLLSGEIYDGRGQSDRARSNFEEALAIALSGRIMRLALAVLIAMARRNASNDPETSVMWLACVLAHPAVDAELRADAEALLEAISGVISDVAYQIAYSRGEASKLESLTAAILR